MQFHRGEAYLTPLLLSHHQPKQLIQLRTSAHRHLPLMPCLIAAAHDSGFEEPPEAHPAYELANQVQEWAEKSENKAVLVRVSNKLVTALKSLIKHEPITKHKRERATFSKILQIHNISDNLDIWPYMGVLNTFNPLTPIGAIWRHRHHNFIKKY